MCKFNREMQEKCCDGWQMVLSGKPFAKIAIIVVRCKFL